MSDTNKPLTTEERIAELERLLRDAQYFMAEDFPSTIKPEELNAANVVATPRYLQLWKDLNRALRTNEQ